MTQKEKYIKKNEADATTLSELFDEDIQPLSPEESLQRLLSTVGMQQRNVCISYEKPQKTSDDSVELKKTTKGTSWTVKVYGDGAEALDRANKLYEQCEQRYGGEDI